jgi:hypothetical protein
MDVNINQSLQDVEMQDIQIPDPQDVINQLVMIVQLAELPTLRLMVQEAIKPELLPPPDFLDGLTDLQKTDVFRGCFLFTFFHLAPRFLIDSN